MNDERDLLTIGEVAKELRVGELAVRGWINEGRLEALRLGSHPKARIRVERAALDRFLKPTSTPAGTLRPFRRDDRGKTGTIRT